MKRNTLIGLVALMVFTGCSKEDSSREIVDLSSNNIEVVSLLPTTKPLGIDKCPEIAPLFPNGKEPESYKKARQECKENSIQRQKEDKTYYYEYTYDTKIMCRNIPKQLRTGAEAHPLKNYRGLDSRKIINQVARRNRKTYFYISEESDLGNPVIDIFFLETDYIIRHTYQEYKKCEIAETKQSLKKSYEEVYGI